MTLEAGSRILVTGSAGRFGRSVVRALAQAGHEVLGVDTAPGTPPTDMPAGVATLPADLTDLGEAFEVMARFRPRAVVHLAAVATPFSRTDAFTYRVNTQLAFNVCEAAARTGVERVVVASSPTVIGYGAPGGWEPARLPIDEGHPVAPWNAYSLSKLIAEEVMASFARSSPGTAFAAVRPCFVIAPEEWEGAPTQSGHTVRERLDRPELAGVSLFNYVDARDASELVLTLLDRLPGLPPGEVFFAGAADALAREPLAELLPRILPATAGHVARLTGTAPAFSSAKAERLLGWQAKRSWRTEIGEI
ncbi:nucleoside-diphosphate-sugar epimerase [Microtetraspora sp. NBRC 13810]|uniref:NAD-dependent epimerase/dehydratase family protein n=1 Tax=Microtetraspora sp. NBRC 13810 TaxID=3030990 RepID=UPI0024A0E9D5|nr:NAD(P)-dependent oxidoreductase [Microtetraspora sp. NBRC 13810]GLW08506.1 nucleoside-diphosphate-sugar epimerase [Microtetraspora sp. NBRC 13810]